MFGISFIPIQQINCEDSCGYMYKEVLRESSHYVHKDINSEDSLSHIVVLLTCWTGSAFACPDPTCYHQVISIVLDRYFVLTIKPLDDGLHVENDVIRKFQYKWSRARLTYKPNRQSP